MRASQASNNSEPVQPNSARSVSAMRAASQSTNNSEQIQPPSARSLSSMRSSQATNNFEQPQQPSARFNSMRSSQSTSSMEQPLSARANSATRPSLGVKSVAMVPPAVPLSLRPTSSGIPTDSQQDKQKDKR